MADWVWTESAGSALEEEPRIKSVRLGDGYEQRSPDGINFMLEVWNLVFDGVDNAEGDLMIAFLRTHQGHLPFSYVPMRSTTAKRYICRAWSRTTTVPGECSIRARFEQVAEP